MPRAPSKPWFAPKRYGYGAGLPIAWQGWAVLAAYVLTCVAAAILLPRVSQDPGVVEPAIIGVVLVATVVLTIICARKTEGGWHWRWGGRS